MKKQDSRVGQRDVSTTPSAKVSTDKFARASALAKVQPSDSAPPTAVIPLMMLTKLSLSSASPSRWRTAPSSPDKGLENSPTHSSASSTAADTPRTTRTFGAKLTVDVVSSIPNSLLSWTWHTLTDKGGHSTLRTSHSNLVQDVANKFYMVDLHIHS